MRQYRAYRRFTFGACCPSFKYELTIHLHPSSMHTVPFGNMWYLPCCTMGPVAPVPEALTQVLHYLFELRHKGYVVKEMTGDTFTRDGNSCLLGESRVSDPPPLLALLVVFEDTVQCAASSVQALSYWHRRLPGWLLGFHCLKLKATFVFE